MIQEKIYCEMNWRKKIYILKETMQGLLKQIALNDAIPRKSSTKMQKIK